MQMIYDRQMTKFLLDSGDPNEYKAIAAIAKKKGSQIWGSTTNPSLIAKKLSRPEQSRRVNQKFTQQEAFNLQKKIVLEILDTVPGAVSAEVYADEKTSADEMIEQGRIIATWHKRVYVKLPTILEGFKARSVLRREKIPVNNTLVFSQEQVFAICLHEKLIQKEEGPIAPPAGGEWPPFISPFVGRLDDIGQDGMSFVENAMKMKNEYKFTPWMLEASIRNAAHIKRGIACGVEIMTAPAKAYEEWFALTNQQKETLNTTSSLTKTPYWQPPDELLSIANIAEFMDALEVGALDIKHTLTDKGLIRFAQDWQAIIK